MADYNYDLPFGIMDVVKLLGLRIRRPGNRSLYADCPFCGDSRKKLNINLEKNVFRCNYCGESGGAVALYAKLHNIDNSAAYAEIHELLYGTSGKTNGDFKANNTQRVSKKFLESAKPASIYDKHQTYALMLTMLTLTQTHREKLRERGLSDNDIERLGYKSTPAFGFDKLVQNLIDMGCIVCGVPGFYKKPDEKWTVNFKSYCSGILIPVISIAGDIQAFQIRLDKPFEDNKGRKTKYIWLSSADEYMGITSGGPAHFIGDPCSEKVFVTEGPLKASIANALSGETFLAVPGAGNIDCLKESFGILKKNGVKRIFEAFDQDKYTNENVQRGSRQLIKLIGEFGFKASVLKWDSTYKGVDDFLLAKKEYMN